LLICYSYAVKKVCYKLKNTGIELDPLALERL